MRAQVSGVLQQIHFIRELESLHMFICDDDLMSFEQAFSTAASESHSLLNCQRLALQLQLATL